jgi:hypothetical protein
MFLHSKLMLHLTIDNRLAVAFLDVIWQNQSFYCLVIAAGLPAERPGWAGADQNRCFIRVSSVAKLSA